MTAPEEDRLAGRIATPNVHRTPATASGTVTSVTPSLWVQLATESAPVPIPQVAEHVTPAVGRRVLLLRDASEWCVVAQLPEGAL